MGEEGVAAGEAANVARQSGAHPLAEEAERVAASLSGRLSEPRGRDGVAPAAAAEAAPDNHGARGVTTLDDSPAQPTQAAGATTTTTTTTDAAPSAAPVESAGGGTAEGDGADAPRPAAGAVAASRGGGVVRARAAAVGASVGGSLKPRVERLREASSVVLDEAAEDPGVRFLVVAAVLFLAFLLLWLFSFVLG